MPHQVVGVAWMRRKELEKTLKGGILADDMVRPPPFVVLPARAAD